GLPLAPNGAGAPQSAPPESHSHLHRFHLPLKALHDSWLSVSLLALPSRVFWKLETIRFDTPTPVMVPQDECARYHEAIGTAREGSHLTAVAIRATTRHKPPKDEAPSCVET